MNKKALTISAIISLALIAFLIIVIAIGFSIGWSELFERFGLYFPSGNRTTNQQTQLSQIRYNILEDEVQYLSGSRWLDFQNQEEKSGNKIINKTLILNSFTKHYYTRTLPKTFQLEKRVNRKVKETGIPYDASFTLEKFEKNGSSFITAITFGQGLNLEVNPQGNPVTNSFILTADNQLYLAKPEIDIFTNQIVTNFYLFTKIDLPEQEIIAKISNWRLDALLQPLEITFKEDNTQKTESFCTKLFDSIYLFINLNEPGTECQPN